MRKSKLIVFLLSFYPGLGHLYLGCMSRGYVFLGLTTAGLIVIFGLCALANSSEPLFLLLGYPLLWLVALVDGMAMADVVNQSVLRTGNNTEAVVMTMPEQNRKVIACLLSVIPGAGHMYLGYQRLGLELMTLFFFTLFFIDWIRISLFIFILPVIWCYSMFDALHKAAGGETAKEDDLSLFALWTGKKGGVRVLGYVLIALGLLLIFERVVLPHIPYEIRHYLQTVIVALILIAGGLKLLVGQPEANRDKWENYEEVKECEGGE